MLAARLCHHDHRQGAVRLRVERLDAVGGVACIARAAEAGAGVVFLRLVLEHHDHFARRIEALVVIIAHAGGGDAEAREGERSGDVHIVAETADDLGRFPALLRGAQPQGERVSCGIGAVFDQRHALVEAGLAFGIGGGRLQPCLGKFGGDPFHRGIIARLQRHAAQQRIRGDEGKVCPQVHLADVLVARGLRGGDRGEMRGVSLRDPCCENPDCPAESQFAHMPFPLIWLHRGPSRGACPLVRITVASDSVDSIGDMLH